MVVFLDMLFVSRMIPERRKSTLAYKDRVEAKQLQHVQNFLNESFGASK